MILFSNSIISSTFTSQNSNIRDFPSPLFIISIDFIHRYNPLLFLFILMLRLSQYGYFWEPFQTTSYVPWTCPQHFFEHFLTFWHMKEFLEQMCSRPILNLALGEETTWKQPVLEPLGSFCGWAEF